jgi:hypothetical protein
VRIADTERDWEYLARSARTACFFLASRWKQMYFVDRRKDGTGLTIA